jgi:hypothetical protein
MTDALADALAGLSIEKQAEIRTAAQGFYSAEPTEFEKQAAALDLTRTLATVLKPQKPEPYEGAIDAEACFNFIENQEEYFNIVGLDETLWTKYTAVSLRDDAKAWWRSAEMTLTTPWPIFRKAFTDYHTPPNAVAAARTALENLRQNKMTVATYTHKFRRHLRLIPSMDSGSILHTYMKGLEPNTSKEVKLRQPETLGQAVHQASVIHAVLYPDQPDTLPKPPSSALPKPSSSAMEIDNLRLEINNLRKEIKSTKGNNFRRGNNNGGKITGTIPYPPPLSAKQRAYLVEHEGCFRCRRLGHMSNECEVVFSGRAVNQVAVGDSPESGKASDD